MKRLFFAICLLGSIPVIAGGGDPPVYRKAPNTAFKRGEELKYRVHYGAMNAGVATFTIDQSNKLINGRTTFHAVAKGNTISVFEWFYKVRDHYESYFDEEALMPWIFIRRTDEGGFKINQNQTYDHNLGRVNSNGKLLTVPKYIQDMVSSFYYARTLDFTNAKDGDVFSVPTFIDDSVWTMKLKFKGRETIKTDLGKVKCLKFVPVVQKGRVFKKEEDLTIWISDDVNHVPLRAQGSILVGSIKMDIISTSGLMVPLTIVK
ncbi:MAG TPA: DUF3108 domain-containing protein [Bacteroidia bacterium]|nr:DUF3108 domain-containing protein [Bacteroidia bacterium]